MSNAPQRLRLTEDDLFSQRVEAYLEEQQMLARAVPEVAPQPFIVRVFYSSYFYLSIASGLGAFIAWALLEPFYDDNRMQATGWIALLWFPMVTGFVGIFLGASEGIMCRNLQRALISTLVGAGVGFVGGLASFIAAAIVFVIMTAIAAAIFTAQHPNPAPGQDISGFGFLVFIMGRSVAWSIAAIPAGLGQGIALKERKVFLNGLLGAVLGGLLGGLLFDPIGMLFAGRNGTGDLSRAVGFTTIGIMVGLFVGLVEQWTKSAWVLMRAGPLAGKQFIIHRNPTVLGSSPKADIYLFKDAAIEPQHALIHNYGGRYEIEDCNSPDGTYVNGIPVHKQVLKAGDQIVLGKTILEFAIKESQ